MSVAVPVVRQVDPRDEAALRAWHDALQRALADGRPAAPLTSFAENLARLSEPNDFCVWVPLALTRGDTVLAAARLELPSGGNSHLLEFELGVPPDLRGSGYGSTLLGHILDSAAAYQRSTLVAGVHAPIGGESPGTRFAARHGFRRVLHEERQVCPLPVDDAVLTAIEAESAAHHPGYAFRSWLGACPPELVADFAALNTAMELDEPLGELDYQPVSWDTARVRDTEEQAARMGRQTITTLAVATGGEAAGYTRVFVSADDPEHVMQTDTLVLRAHRGHRLAGTLKVRNLRLLAEHFPGHRYLNTWTSTDNTAMRRINEAFGFVAAESVYDVQRGLGEHS